MKLSDNLKIIRKENNLSQEQLAEKLGVSRQAVSKWESGQSYPEMDKVLLICKLFNYNIDELMNENVKEVSEDKKSKNNINKYIDDFFAFITKTVDMLSSMSFKEKMKCFIEQVVMIMILSIVFVILGSVASSILIGIINGFENKILIFLGNVLEAIYIILALILEITILLHVFKIRYLDYYEISDNNYDNVTEENLKELTNDNKNRSKEKIILEKKKIIIRDPEHSQSKFANGIIKAILWFIKFCVAFVLFGFACSFVALVVLLVLSFLFVKTGLVFVGAFLGILSALIINFIILEILFNFIISKTNRKRKIAIFLMSSILIGGLGIGLFLIGVTKFDYIENSKVNNEIEDKYEVQMSNNLFISNYYNDIEYVETESDKVEIVVKHSKYYKIDFLEDNDNCIYVHYIADDAKLLELIRTIIKDINDKNVKNYGLPEIYVYTSKENIEKLQKNYNQREIEIENQISELERLENQVFELQWQIDELNDEKFEKDNIIEELNEQISDLKQELKEIEEIN